MPLNDGTFLDNLKDSFKANTWIGCATALATAIDDYLKLGTVNTIVVGMVTPPIPPPYAAAGVGIGTITTPGPASMIPVFTLAFASPTWVTVGAAIAPAINTYIVACTVSTIDSAVLVGTGTGVIIPTGLPALTASLTAAFLSLGTWDSVAGNIKDAVKAFIITSTVATIDLGVVPPNSWAGTGSGSIS